MKLYYNAAHPIEILESLTIKTSICCGRDRGVSMSSQRIDSHGAFTFIFKEGCTWFSQFTEVEYGNFSYMGFVRENEDKSLEEHQKYDFTHKVQDLEDEHEWWSPIAVHFKMEDVKRVIFRIGSPGHRIHPRITGRNYKALQARFPSLVI